jgi:hypothetical protein
MPLISESSPRAGFNLRVLIPENIYLIHDFNLGKRLLLLFSAEDEIPGLMYAGKVLYH